MKSANFAKNITNLNLRWNQIQRVDSSLLSIFSSIEHLNLASNEITGIETGSFRVTPKLAYLDLSNNHLGDALMQPAALSGLQCLRQLNLINCSIKAFHRHAFTELKNLKYLYLARNQLSVIPVSALAAAPCLIFLNVAYNKITYIYNDFRQLNRLEFLFLNGNGLESIHPGALDGFDRLEQIVLNNNKLSYLPVGLQTTLLQMPSSGISLVNVTWRCDCRLLWLVHLEQKAAMTSSVAAPSLPRCFLPRHLSNTPLRDVDLENLRCPKLAGCEEDQLSSLQCEWCPPYQKPIQGGINCTCMEGYEYVPHPRTVCQPCPLGFYKQEVSNGTCAPCPGNSTTLAVGAKSCLCNAGFAQTPKKICEPCGPNTYKHKVGNHQCHPYPDDCEECIANANPNHASVDAGPAGGGGDKNMTLSAKVTGTDVTTNHPPFPKSGVIVAIAVGAVVVGAVLIVLVLSVVCSKRLPCRKRPDFFTDSTDSSRHLLEVTIEKNIVSHTTPDTKLHIRRMRVGRLLGRGAFGQVHAGVVCVCQNDAKKTIPVAVKRLRDKTSDEEGKILQEELEQMILVGPHPNIIQLIGSCLHEGNLHIIMELAEDGDLLTYLRQGKLRHEQYVSVGPDGTLREQQAMVVTDHSELMLFAWHIAKGMSHLECIKCIHRDLAARNCLLTAGPVAKLSDFGLSRDVYENGYYFRHSKGRVPFKWLSPEALLWGQYSNKSDVWSYGILLWEVATFGGTPYSGVPPDRIADMHRARYRLPQPPACPDNLYRVMRCCWHEDPRKRPTFRTLCDVLEGFVQAAADAKYLDLQGQTRPSLADVTTETDGTYRNKTSPYRGGTSPYENNASPYRNQHQSLDMPSFLPHSRLSLKRPRGASEGPCLTQMTLKGKEDSGGEMELNEEAMELKPMLSGLCSEWSGEAGSVTSHKDAWDEAKHGNREQNYTSGYSSSRSIAV